MPEQPQNMADLVRSVIDTQRAQKQAVIPTIATHRFPELSSAQRTHLSRYMQGTVAEYIGLDTLQPGETVVAAQTDEWYRTHDHKGTFVTLISYVQFAAQRTR